ncbi:MAG TPA: response regulator [Chloroflexi bacterium]|nr:response regulator [Chloroflexota bacterium]
MSPREMPGKRRTVLLIEDNPKNARLMRRVLEREGFSILHAATGEEGIEIATEEEPDLILLDLGLPDVDGQTVAAYLKQDETLASIPLIVVTAWPSEAAREMVDAYGCEGYIGKPIDTREFPRLIANYLDIPSP